jgi:hypothetical protein
MGVAGGAVVGCCPAAPPGQARRAATNGHSQRCPALPRLRDFMLNDTVYRNVRELIRAIPHVFI